MALDAEEKAHNQKVMAKVDQEIKYMEGTWQTSSAMASRYGIVTEFDQDTISVRREYDVARKNGDAHAAMAAYRRMLDLRMKQSDERYRQIKLICARTPQPAVCAKAQ